MLSAGPTPQVDLADWSFLLRVGPRPVKRWTWAEFNALPQTRVTRDIHCVTKWTKLDTAWQGVLIDDLLADAGLAPPTPYLLAHGFDGYSTNVPVADLVGGKAMVATHYDGAPLAPDHGGPARLLVPHLYFWKSAKWVNGLQFTEERRGGVLGAARLSHLRRPLARAALHRRLRWPAGARPLAAARRSRPSPPLTPRVKGFVLRPAGGAPFVAGQHLDIRLTAPDGYQAQRSYSVTSAPEREGVYEVVVDLLPDGEVSPYFHEVAAVGDTIEIRGPFGGHFAWSAADGGPLLLVGGGSGVAPLMSMLRHRAARAPEVPARWSMPRGAGTT